MKEYFISNSHPDMIVILQFIKKQVILQIILKILFLENLNIQL